MIRPALDRLCTLNHNETPHSLYVTRLALALFDETASVLGISRRNRRLLEAACRLHDIGYHADRQNHATKGAEIIRKKKIQGFTDNQCDTVASIVALHQYAKAQSAPNLRITKRVKELAAFLRVADGLDHSHMQDALVCSIECAQPECRVVVLQQWYDGNCDRANAKADLWNEVFPAKIIFHAENLSKRKSLFDGAVRLSDTIITGIQRVLFSQYRTILDNQKGAFEGTGPEFLHDLRVALRRYRAALQLLSRFFPETRAPQLNEMLRGYSNTMGQVRDADVWFDFLTKKKLIARRKDNDQWLRYIHSLEEQKSQGHERLQQLLVSAEWKSMLGQMAYFNRIELSELSRKHTTAAGYRDIGLSRLASFYKRLKKKSYLIKSGTPDAMHKLRKFCRRERYYAEFFAPVAGKPARKLYRRLHAITSALGKVHDMDVALERFASGDHAAFPAELEKETGNNRSKAVAEFKKAWKLLNDKKLKHECSHMVR
ncbi:MAG: CHAD domain-containing protein [Chitinivibrionales bacterium]|nr:CHAD domain-containing protein [Chitinivibrionales bacterium]